MKRKRGIQTSMCRLNTDPSGKEVDQPRDVLSSPRYMLGRGVKRKLSDCEMVGGAGPGAELPYPQQRQLVLDLCLDKLQRCRARVEPSLHRSVLLANTLRQIQEEMRREGGTPPSGPTPSPAHTATPLHTPDLPPIPKDYSLSPRELGIAGDCSAGEPLACPGCEGQSVVSSSSEEGCTEDLTVGARSADSLFGSFEITNSTSYLTDLAFDDIFEDIDTSMYDSSDFSALALSPARSSGAPSGVEDSLKPFPSCTTASALQLCLTDLNDLDHIMEILVGS
uniref:SERTA domain-containing protein 2-like n=1 Tax=Paramormyrops kingsleyae TaxID=1676925 RepID=A0A3B3RTN3_9TELE|nr:SERTA domain-containing protein 2-like isoform X1 [Paramormyrops kingsleyae]